MKSIHETMSTLWRHAEKSLTVEELDNLATATEEAVMMAQNLATTCDRLGNLASEDDGEGWSGFSDPQSRAALLQVIKEKTAEHSEVAKLAALGLTVANDMENYADVTREQLQKGGVKQ